MKKLLLMLTLGAAFTGFSQDMYFTPYVGYGLGYPGITSMETVGDTGSVVFNTKTVGFGKGLNAGVSFGVLLEDGVGVDFAISYQNNLGQSLESESTTIIIGPGGMPVMGQSKEVQTFNAWSVQFTPSIRFEMDGADIKPFAQVGPSVLFSGFSITDEVTAGGNSMKSKEKYSHNITIGANAKAGVEFELSSNIMLVTALQFNMGYTSPASSEVTEYSVNGEDRLDDLTTAEKETNYEKEGKIDDFFGDPDEPSMDARMRYDYSSLGLIVGVKFLLD